MPSYYHRFFGLEEAAAAAVSGGAGLVGIVTGIGISSWLGDRWHGRRPGWRVALGGWSLVLGTVGFAGAIANLTAANADVVAAHRRGLGFAVLQFLVTLGGALGPWLIGLASDATGSLRWAFSIVVVPLVIGCLFVLAGRRTYDTDAAAALAATEAEPADAHAVAAAPAV